MLKIAIWITNRWVDELLKIEQWGITLTVPMAFVMPDDWNHTSIDWDEKTLSGQNSRVARRECFVVPKGSDLPRYMLQRATVTCRERNKKERFLLSGDSLIWKYLLLSLR
jgi:hypothetical protein